MKRFILLSLILMLSGLVYGQQTISVSGFVQDQSSRIGMGDVTIRSTKLKRALGSTDRKGLFKIQAPVDDILIFTSTGFKTVTENLAGKKAFVFTIYMEKQENELDEVVVQGYQQRKRETLTGASVTISGKDLQDNPVSNVTELLQGKVAGMNVQMTTGQPGVRASVLIRGLNSISSTGTGSDAFLTPTSPLYIVDGVPVDDNTDFQYGFNSGGTGISPISLIPPEDIESMDILKDAAATALYGSRGAYGVIRITTKRGRSKIPIIQYTTNQFFSVPPQLRSVLGGKDERLIRINQVLENDVDYYTGRDKIYDNQILSDSLNPYFNNSTNWQKVFYKPTYNQTHNVNASGGDENFNYKINGQYYNEKGIIQNTGFSRYTLSMNSEYRQSDRFRLFVNMSGNIGEQQTGSGNSVTQGGVAKASSASSLLPAPSSSIVGGGLVSALEGRNDNRTTDVKANVDLEYEVFKGMRAKNSFSYNYITYRTDNFMPAIANNNISQNYNYDAQRNSMYNLFQLSYLKAFGAEEKHLINTYVFNELNLNSFKAKAQRKSGYPNDQLEGPFGFDAGSAVGGVLNNLADVRSAGFAGAFSYQYDSKYIIDFTYRLDKSSSVGPDVPWVKNPSISARWNMAKEPFMDVFTDKWLDYFSFRGGWGKNITPTGTVFDANGRYIFTGAFNNNPTIGFNWNQMPNSKLVPSTTTSSSLAIEAGFLKNRITTIQEFYYKQVDDQLWSRNLADHNGFTSLQSNEVSFVNYGYEFTFMFRPLSNQSKVNWSISLNGAINNEVLTRLPDNSREYLKYDANNKLHTLYRLGRNTMSHVLFDYRGTFATDAAVPVNPATGEPYKMIKDGAVYYFQAGDPYWTDLNGDYILDENDLVTVGNSQPKVIGGLSTFAQYKGISLSINTSFTLKRDIINEALANQMNSYGNPLMGGTNGIEKSTLLPLDKYNFWLNNGDISAYPNPYGFTRQGIITPFRANQTLFMEDGSYWKINSVTLSYTFPREKTQRYKISSLRVYGTANNVYTFSNYSGPNPENVTDMGYDRTDGYPNKRTYTLGLNVQF
ncbi:SusC/RagA family TonB-linked outer membrane protein [Sphingobacterium spiritivorum]|uniref:SusC/RagA family TonB-linked outer membrane protein n=1 Tax=Sphingobacterium spiritivorum TaxID=258 RepID=UPI003DA3C525